MATDHEKDVIRRIMAEREVICAWMDAMQADKHWVPCDLNLDALWEVENLLTCVQNQKYLHELRGLSTWGKVHATAAQKIKALAAVLRNGETSDGE